MKMLYLISSSKYCDSAARNAIEFITGNNPSPERNLWDLMTIIVVPDHGFIRQLRVFS